MLYTVGLKKLYDQLLAQHQPLKKSAGGSVYLCNIDAVEAISDKPEYSVYGLDCDITSTYTYDHKSFFLARPVAIIRLK